LSGVTAGTVFAATSWFRWAFGLATRRQLGGISSEFPARMFLRNVTAKYAFERSYGFLVIHRISKIPRGALGAFDDMPFIDALYANDL
jgi:hypothetical protein